MYKNIDPTRTPIGIYTYDNLKLKKAMSKYAVQTHTHTHTLYHTHIHGGRERETGGVGTNSWVHIFALL